MARRKLTGIFRRCGGWRVFVRVRGHLYSATFPLDAPVPEMRAWRERQIETFGDATAGSFGADVADYLTRVTAMPSYTQRAAHLSLWTADLGRDRPRGTHHPHRDRSSPPGLAHDVVAGDRAETPDRAAIALRHARRDVCEEPGPRLGESARPRTGAARPRLPHDRAHPCADARPAGCETRRGPAASAREVARRRPRVHRPPAVSPATLTPHDTNFIAGTGLARARRKGQGAAARTLLLTADGLAALHAFHAAKAYGPFATEAINRSFKRAARRVGVDPRVRL